MRDRNVIRGRKQTGHYFACKNHFSSILGSSILFRKPIEADSCFISVRIVIKTTFTERCNQINYIAFNYSRTREQDCHVCHFPSQRVLLNTGNHLLRFLTFCQKNITSDKEYEVEFDGDELFYVDPMTYRVETCQYNIPHCIVALWEKIWGVPNTLICQVINFHSTPVDVTWTINEQPVGERTISQTQYYSNEDFSFRIFSYLSITPQEGDIYSCSVGHISLQEPFTRNWGESLLLFLHYMSVCVGSVTLGVVGVATGVWFIKKAKRSGWALRT
uniref:Ig-like domain-containing protein n=1 Tax=Oncorhynchus tshawytscha TaxID=74940 RepID=A0A8C8FLT2_ONCTS